MKDIKKQGKYLAHRILWLLTFAALGCSSGSFSCKKLENLKQTIVIVNKLGEKPKDKFPQQFVNLLFIKNADTLPPGYKPTVLLTRLDMEIKKKSSGFGCSKSDPSEMKFDDIQNQGLNGWSSFTRNIFPLSPDDYDPDLAKRFEKNEIGPELSAKSTVNHDSTRIKLLNKYILKQYQEDKPFMLIFYSANPQNTSYCCQIDLADTTKKTKVDSLSATKKTKKKGKGIGCANSETSAKKVKEALTKLDTIFPVYHSIETINTLIAMAADSMSNSKSGCSVKDKTINYIIIYEPPITPCSSGDTSIRIINADKLDTLNISLESKTTTHTFGPFKTNVPADSIRYELVNNIPGVKIDLQNKYGDSCRVQFTGLRKTTSGDFIIKVTPVKDTLTSVPSEIKITLKPIPIVDTIKPTCTFVLQTTSRQVKFSTGETKTITSKQPLITAPAVPDSIIWELTKVSEGITIKMPNDRKRGNREIPAFDVLKDKPERSGTITFSVTAFKKSCDPKNPVLNRMFVFNIKGDIIKPPKTSCSKSDTTETNHLRRQIILDFRDYLFMYAKTESKKEKEFFKLSAINKIHEIPEVKLNIIPQTDIYVLFEEAIPVESDWSFTPVYDSHKCLIEGVTVKRKK